MTILMLHSIAFRINAGIPFFLKSRVESQIENGYDDFPPYPNESDSIVYYTYRHNYDFEYEYKITEKHNSSGKIIDKIWQTESYRDYYNFKRYQSSYSSDSLINWERNYIWSNTERNWKLIDETNYSYMNLVYIKEKSFKKQIGSDDTLMTLEMAVYSYDIDDTLRQIIVTERDSLNLQWKNKKLTSFNYIIEENLKTQTVQLWNDETNSWVNDNQMEEFSENNVTKITYRLWDKEKTLWINLRQEEFSYNISHEVVSVINAYYNLYTGLWKEEFKIEYTYENDLLQKVEYLYWDLTNQFFTANELVEFEYDAGNYWMSTSYSYKNDLNSSWILSYLITTEEKEVIIPTNLQETKSQDINIYPNPVEKYLYVIGLPTEVNKEYYIINFDGIIIDQGILNSEGLNIENLEKGMYIINVKIPGDQEFRLKFLKK